MQIVRKQGRQSTDDTLEFVFSTESPDRHGDIVDQSWKLSAFRKNPIALYQHDATMPIGTWRDVRVVDGELRGKLNLADPGTSQQIDTIRSLVEQRILRAVSVGFQPGNSEPLNEKDPWGGYRLSDNELYECSLVSVPANRESLIQRGLNPLAMNVVSDMAYSGLMLGKTEPHRRRARQHQIYRIRAE